MDSPVRKMLKLNDYARHKLLRKIKRCNKAAAEKDQHAAEKALKKKLRVTPPKYDDGKLVVKEYANPEDIHVNPDGSITTRSGNTGDVILPDVTVRPLHLLYKSAYDGNAAGEFVNVMASAPFALADTALNAVGVDGQPVLTTAGYIGETFSPTRWYGTVRSGFEESPWSDNNPGMWGNPYLDLMTDLFPILGGMKATGNKLKPIIYNTTKTFSDLKDYSKFRLYKPLSIPEYMIAHSNVGKRAIELAMRAGFDSNGLNTILRQYKDPSLQRSALKYILSGKEKYKNDLIEQGAFNYTGSGRITEFDDVFWDSPNLDLIDAYLYDKKLPLKDVTNEGYGVHSEEVKKPYVRNKRVRVYNTDEFEGTKSSNKKNLKTIGIAGINSPMSTIEGFDIDTLGHLVETAMDETGKVFSREQDVWKFDPEAYLKKYNNDFDLSTNDASKEVFNKLFNGKLKKKTMNKVYKNIIESGVNIVNEAGTPLIFRSNWR